MTNPNDIAFNAGFLTFIITSLSWALLWAIVTIVRLADEKNKRDRKDN